MGENGLAFQGKGFVRFDSVLKIVFESLFFFKVVSYNGSKSILEVELYFKNSYIILKRVKEKKCYFLIRTKKEKKGFFFFLYKCLKIHFPKNKPMHVFLHVLLSKFGRCNYATPLKVFFD